MLSKILAALPKPKVFHMLAFAGALACLIASGARADLIATIFACIALLVLNLEKRKSILILALGAVVGLGFWTMRDGLNQFAPIQIKSREIKLEDRLYVWLRQIDIFQEKPWFGWGLEKTGWKTGSGRMGSEGSYTELLDAVGACGAVPFFLGVGFCVWRFTRFVLKVRNNPALITDRQRDGLIGALGIICYIMVVSTSEDHLSTSGDPNCIFIWVTLAAGAVMRPVQARQMVSVRQAPAMRARTPDLIAGGRHP
jgi:O-antigen ligase